MTGDLTVGELVGDGKPRRATGGIVSVGAPVVIGEHGCSLAVPRPQASPVARRPCSCRTYLDDGRPNRNPDGSVKEVTVACDVHHVMADGAPASLHEVLCPCGQFADDRECTVYLDEDGEPEHVCNGKGCAEIFVRDCGFTLPGAEG